VERKIENRVTDGSCLLPSQIIAWTYSTYCIRYAWRRSVQIDSSDAALCSCDHKLTASRLLLMLLMMMTI